MSEELNPELPPDDQAIIEEATKVVTAASDLMDMEGLFGLLTRLGFTLAAWRKVMRAGDNPLPDEWIDEAAMKVWGKFWHE